MTDRPSQVRLDASLDPQLSRWLWLVKWLLLIPHYIVLAFLWIGYVVVVFIAFFAILFTERFPRALFEYNLGVLRWSWRVHHYSYAALGTDRYPPFTLADVPDYPARLDVAYPERLNRWLPLVKWLLAIPHLIVIAIFAGGGSWFVWRFDNTDFNWAAGGLIGILVLVSAVVLLFTGNYPQPIYDFVLGMDRWVVRVAAYIGLMTDEYPPFRLDSGGAEPGPAPLPQPQPTAGETAATPAAAPDAEPRPGGWTTGRVVSVVCGALLSLVAAGLITGGSGLMWADRTSRDADNFLHTPSVPVTGSGYALVTESIEMHGADISASPVSDIVGKVRLTVSPDNPAVPVFVGIAPATAVDQYLAGAAVTVVTDLNDDGVTTVDRAGGPVTAPPSSSPIWSAKAEGTGTQTLTWQPTAGDWRVVVMNADAAPVVATHISAGAEVPALFWIAFGLIVFGVLVLGGGVALIVVPLYRASQRPTGPPPQPSQPTPTV